jgi:hypothetical protein
MCQHGMVDKRFLKSCLLISHSVYGQRMFVGFLESSSYHYFAIDNYSKLGLPLLSLVTFYLFFPSPCMTCFVLLVMGLGPRFFIFPLRAPICAFCIFGFGLLLALPTKARILCLDSL